MHGHSKSYAQPLLVVVLFLAWQQQHPSLYQPTAALSVWDTARLSKQQQVFFTPPSAVPAEAIVASGAFGRNLCGRRQAEPAVAAAKHVFTAPHRQKDGNVTLVGGEHTLERSRHNTVKKLAVVLTFEAHSEIPAEVIVELYRESAGCATAAGLPRLCLRRLRSTISTVFTKGLSDCKGILRYPFIPSKQCYPSTLLPGWGRVLRKTDSALAGSASTVYSVNTLTSRTSVFPERLTARQPSFFADVVPTASTSAEINESIRDTCRLLSSTNKSARFSSSQAAANPRMLASALVGTRASCIVCISPMLGVSEKSFYRSVCIWKTTHPYTAAVACLAAILLPPVRQGRSRRDRQELQDTVSQVPWGSQEEKEKHRFSCCRRSSSGSITNKCGTYTGRGGMYLGLLNGRYNEGDCAREHTAALRKSSLGYRCKAARGFTEGNMMAARETSSLFGALCSCVDSTSKAADAIVTNIEATTAVATATACGTASSSTVLRDRHSDASTSEKMQAQLMNNANGAQPGSRNIDGVDACTREAAVHRPRLWCAHPTYTPVITHTRWTALSGFQVHRKKLAADMSACDLSDEEEEERKENREALEAPASIASIGKVAALRATAAMEVALLTLADVLLPAGSGRLVAKLAPAPFQKTQGPSRVTEEKIGRTAAATATMHARKATISATYPGKYCELQPLSCMKENLQRQSCEGRREDLPTEGVEVIRKAQRGAVNCMGGRIRSGFRKEDSSTKNGNLDIRKNYSSKSFGLGPRNSRRGMKKTLAWLFWRKKGDDYKQNEEELRESDNSEIADTSSHSASESEDVFAGDSKGRRFLVDNKAAEEARRQAFRSPVVAAALRYWEETPKFTRFYLSTALALGLLSSLYGQSYPRLFAPAALVFDFPAIRHKGELHRLITSLFYFGPLSLPTLLSLSFVHAYLGGLEQHFQRVKEASDLSSAALSSNLPLLRSYGQFFRFPFSTFLISPFSSHHMFARLLLSSAIAAMTLAAAKQIPNEHLLQCISTSLLHVWSRLYPSGEADFYGLFTVPNEFLPFFFLAQNWLFEGRIVAADLYGLAIAALWLLLVQQRLEEDAGITQHAMQQPSEQHRQQQAQPSS